MGRYSNLHMTGSTRGWPATSAPIRLCWTVNPAS